MKLETYLRDRKLTYRAFAAQSGFDAAQIHRWAKGERQPSLDQAAAIEKQTAGAVRMVDFITSPIPQDAA